MNSISEKVAHRVANMTTNARSASTIGITRLGAIGAGCSAGLDQKFVVGGNKRTINRAVSLGKSATPRVAFSMTRTGGNLAMSHSKGAVGCNVSNSGVSLGKGSAVPN